MSLVINFLTGAPRTPVPPVTGDPPPAGNGRFGDLLSDMWAPEPQEGGFMGDVASPLAGDQQPAAKTVADVFDQHGLLSDGATAPPPATVSVASALAPGGQTAVSADDDAPLSGSIPVAIAESLRPDPAGAAVKSQPGAPVVQRAPIGETSTAFSAMLPSSIETSGPIEAEAPPVTAGVHEALPASGPKPVTQAVARDVAVIGQGDTEDDEKQAAPEPSRSRPAAEQGGTSDVQATLRATAQAATVVVRVNEDGLHERARLRDRITALLSRHGLRTQDVRLNGVTSASAAQAGPEEL